MNQEIGIIIQEELMSRIKVATYSNTCKSIEEHLVNPTKSDVVVRLGGSLPYEKYPIQVNSKDGTEMSIDKFRFNNRIQNTLPTFMCYNGEMCYSLLRNDFFESGVSYFRKRNLARKYIVKPLHSSGGENITIIDPTESSVQNYDKLNKLIEKVGPIIIQPLINVTSEYRIHVSSTGATKVTKKVKNNEEDQFVTRKNHTVYDIANCVKPRRLDDMVAACKKALADMNMDIMCFDVIYDSSRKEEHIFYIVESNTGPELIGSTKQFYIDQINQIIQNKAQ